MPPHPTRKWDGGARGFLTALGWCSRTASTKALASTSVPRSIVSKPAPSGPYELRAGRGRPTAVNVNRVPR